MSHTYRNVPPSPAGMRHPKTHNEQKQVRVSKNYYDTDYEIKIRHRYIPTAWDDVVATSVYQEDHH